MREGNLRPWGDGVILRNRNGRSKRFERKGKEKREVTKGSKKERIKESKFHSEDFSDLL